MGFVATLVAYGQLVTTLGTARSQYFATTVAAHTLTESMLVATLTVTRLICTLHRIFSFFRIAKVGKKV